MSSLSFPDLQPYIESVHDSLPSQLQVYFTRQNIQLLLRVIVIVSSYVLLRPHLESLFKKATGTPDQREEEIKTRMEFLKQQREGGGKSAPRKVMSVVGPDGAVHGVVPPKRTEQGMPGIEKKGKAKGGRKKA